jgi:hypothetical protein
VKRKIKLGKRTAADDQEYENEDEYLSQLAHHNQNRHISRLINLKILFQFYFYSERCRIR